MNNYSELANRYMKQNKKRTVLTIVGITLATILIFAVGTFLFSFRDNLIKDIRSKSDYEFNIMNLNKEQVDKLSNNAEIKNYSILRKPQEFVIKDSDKGACLYAGDDNYFNKIIGVNISEGRFPKNENEILINSNSKNLLNKELGDKIFLADRDGREKSYDIVGIVKAQGYMSGASSDFYTFLNNKDLNNNDEYDVYVNLNSDRDKQEIIKKVMTNAGIEINQMNKSDNGELLYLTGNGGNNGYSEALRNMSIFVILIIMICTVTVIYNSFNISVIERIRYFGILKAIGATPKQIKRIIYKEGYFMGLIALPIGCLIGFLALKYGIKVFLGNDLMFLKGFKVDFYPSVILITAILVLITIYISLIIPARKGMKVSAVEAMRNKNEIKIGKIKRRRGKLVQKVFGIEGSIAYKNIRRTPARFFITIITLTISIVMFNVFYGFISISKETVNQHFVNIAFDAQLITNHEKDGFNEEEINKIKTQNFAKSMDEYYIDILEIPMEKEHLNESYTKLPNSNVDFYEGTDYFTDSNNESAITNDKGFSVVKDYIVEGNLDLNALKKGGVILIDGTMVNVDGKRRIERVTNYKVGDKIKIPKLKNYSVRNEAINLNEINESIKKGEFYEVPIVAILNKEPITGKYQTSGISIMAHEDAYKKIAKNIKPNVLTFNFNGDEKAREDATMYFDKTNFNSLYRYTDIASIKEKDSSIYEQVEFFVYCFIMIISIIAIVNIFNTISTSILIRKKEFGALRAIGMEDSQLRKSIILEGTLYGIVSSLVGGIISAILLGLLIKVSGGLVYVDYSFKFIPFILSIACAIGVTYISALLPLRKISKYTIVEEISNDE